MTVDVAIVGAGLAGPALALMLKKLDGVSTTIFELRPEGYEQGQHISLAPNALRVMQHIGVFEKLKATGYSYEELHVSSAQGARIATFFNGSERLYGYKAMRIHRRDVQRILIEEVEGQGIEIRHGMKLTSIRETEADKVELNFQNGQTARADFVIGADGLYSVVRKHIAPQSESIYTHMLGITGFLPREALHPSVKDMELPVHFIGRNGFIAVMPSEVAGREIGFFSTMDFPEEHTREEWNELFRDKDKIRKIIQERFCEEKGWNQVVDSLSRTADAKSLCTWPFFIAPWLEAWSSPTTGRVLVLGDAAHAILPTGGLGASLAFEDAECLALALTHMTNPSNIFGDSKDDTALRLKTVRMWEDHRKERLKMIQDFTDRNRKLRQPGGTWITQFLKEWFVWALFKFMGPAATAQKLYDYDSREFEVLLNT